MTAVGDSLRYPIGKPDLRPALPPGERQDMIRELRALPDLLREAVRDLTDEQMDTPYRPGGWTVRQVVHHLPDSHVNAYVRFKKAVTEDDPTVQLYDEKAWAAQPDAVQHPADASLVLLEGLHRRWASWLQALPVEAWARTLRHPEVGPMTLDQLLCMYAWHSRHHVAHIRGLREREGW